MFADRPIHAAGHVLTSEFIKEWDEGHDSFAKSPPNATVSVLSNDGKSVKDAVVVLKTPKLDGDKLTFDVSVLEGDLTGASGPASLFIDRFAVHVGGGHVNVVGRGPAWHGTGTRVRVLRSAQASRQGLSAQRRRVLIRTTARSADIIPTRPATEQALVQNQRRPPRQSHDGRGGRRQTCVSNGSGNPPPVVRARSD